MHNVERALAQLCRVVVDIEKAMGGGEGPGEGPAGVDTPGLGALLSLDLSGPLRPGAISELLGMSSGGTTKLIHRLEVNDLVERRLGAVPSDRRAVVVHLTDQGRDAVGRFEKVVRDLTQDLLDALVAIDRTVDDTAWAPSRPVGSPEHPAVDAGSTAGPVLAALFHMVLLVDRPITTAIGRHQFLHPQDPRGLLVLLELVLAGPLRVGSVPDLIDRSRGATHRLLDTLTTAGLVARRRGADTDQRVVVVEPTAAGRRVVSGVVRALTDELPRLLPAMRHLSATLAEADADREPSAGT